MYFTIFVFNIIIRIYIYIYIIQFSSAGYHCLFVNILLYVIVFGYVCLFNCLYIFLIFFNCSLIDDRSLFGLYFNKNYLLTYFGS